MRRCDLIEKKKRKKEKRPNIYLNWFFTIQIFEHPDFNEAKMSGEENEPNQLGQSNPNRQRIISSNRLTAHLNQFLEGLCRKSLRPLLSRFSKPGSSNAVGVFKTQVSEDLESKEGEKRERERERGSDGDGDGGKAQRRSRSNAGCGRRGCSGYGRHLRQVCVSRGLHSWLRALWSSELGVTQFCSIRI